MSKCPNCGAILPEWEINRAKRNCIFCEDEDEEVLQAVEEGYQTTREISQRFDVTQGVARSYLIGLLDKGKLDRRRIGNTYVYRRVEK